MLPSIASEHGASVEEVIYDEFKRQYALNKKEDAEDGTLVCNAGGAKGYKFTQETSNIPYKSTLYLSELQWHNYLFSN